MSNSQQFRKNMGFTNKETLKEFFDSKDIVRNIDFEYICALNTRLSEIIEAINKAVVDVIKPENLDAFINENVAQVYTYMRKKKMLKKFSNNKQRQTERAYYDWSRGRVVANYFKKAMAIIFGVSEDEIKSIGLDNLEDPDNFKKAPTADFEIITENFGTFRIEFQCGFQGINDIKKHKVLEARKIFSEYEIRSLIIHVDLFNGSVAFVDISTIEDQNINWQTREQFEGKEVFSIPDEYFIWDLSDNPPILEDILNIIDNL